ncbi:aminopeptidase [Patescibacteria group bacterium]
MPQKNNYKKLEKDLKFEKQNCWDVWDEKTKNNAFKFCENYKRFLDSAKTEREAVKEGIKIVEKNGFVNIEELSKGAHHPLTPSSERRGTLAQQNFLKSGKKVYAVNRDKNLILAVIGKKFLDDGFKLIMSHIDSPRLDLKVNPLYEDEQLAYFKTHYYGGIKKYHWPTIPLALHGVAVLENGKKVEFTIGEKEDDPIFMITDLLPHLAKAQAKKPLSEAIQGEELNILVGSIPVKDKDIKDKVKLAVLTYLNKQYGIKEEDFFSAEIQAVPSGKSKDLGFDRSLISGYGQDDRVCAFSSMQAILESKPTDKTQICFLTDKEEIGSEGNTGAQSIFLENFIINLLDICGKKNDIGSLYTIFAHSEALSSDVTAGLDPDYKEVHDLRNCARLGCGLAFEKYNGHRGKSCSSEASAEYVAKLRNILNKNKVIWQTAELGKVDEGGGGTIAMYLAKRNMEVIDAGVALFNMHAPLEIASKADIYSAYLGYLAFFGS